jgi:hypothetical protein
LEGFWIRPSFKGHFFCRAVPNPNLTIRNFFHRRTAEAEVARTLRDVHVAVFPNRAESGTNLFATQALAVGVPTVLSNNTGHGDLLELNTPLAFAVVRSIPHTNGEQDSDGLPLPRQTGECSGAHRCTAMQKSRMETDGISGGRRAHATVP